MDMRVLCLCVCLLLAGVSALRTYFLNSPFPTFPQKPTDTQPVGVKDIAPARPAEIKLPGIVVYRNGSYTRTSPGQLNELVSSDPRFVDGVASEDIVVNSSSGVWVRVFLPRVNLSLKWSENCSKLPLVVYFHGGGFVLGSAAGLVFHDFCKRLAMKGGVVVVSVNYRLAPEHRLPAAFEDGLNVLKWLQSEATTLGASRAFLLHANFSACFLMGHSAGAATVHHVALRLAANDLFPLKLAGLILSVPFFGGVTRTQSEIKFGGEGTFLPLVVTDAFWFLSLPKGMNRDHPFCNVLAAQAPQVNTRVVGRALVILGGKDLLYDRQLLYVQALRKAGLEITLVTIREGDHGILVKGHAIEELDQMVRYTKQVVES